MGRGLCLTLMGAGLLLVVISYVWPQETAARAAWTEEKARQRLEAGHELHRLQGMQAHADAPAGVAHSHGDHDQGAPNAAALEEARRQFEGTTAPLEAARNSHAWLITLIKWLGIALAGVGLGGILLQQVSE